MSDRITRPSTTAPRRLLVSVAAIAVAAGVVATTVGAIPTVGRRGA